MDKPKIAQKAPFVMEVKAGTHAWCSCGESSNKPYCDGSHSGTGFAPIIEKIEEDKMVAWCGCKNSANGAFCDGAHSKL